MCNLSPVNKNFRPFTLIFQIFKLYWLCYIFITIAVIALPLTLIIQFLILHSVAFSIYNLMVTLFITHSGFFPLFARVHHFVKIVLYMTLELVKRIPLGIVVIVRHKFFHSKYTCFCTACLAYCALHIKWLAFRTILLSGDIEKNPGPETLDFCTWNLNSITAYDYYECP